MKLDRRSHIIMPLSLIHAGLGALHRNLLLRPKVRDRDRFLPLVVIGGLRAGGSGKTPVAMELARRLSMQNKRVGILAYWMRKPGKQDCGTVKRLGEDLAEVTSQSDWEHCSDEAVLLARESGARVFITRNREQAWDVLSRGDELDVLVSDDGLMDPRLSDAFRIVLKMPDETPGVFDLLPSGPYRTTAGILNDVDCIVEGPVPTAESNGFWFRRELVIPGSFERRAPCWAVCGVGRPEAFRRDLLHAGVNVIGMSSGPDHGLPDLGLTRNRAAQAGASGFICTAKDWIKLAGQAGGLSPVTVVGERIEMGPGLVSAVKEYLVSHASS